jgi:adenylyl cyclase-associated protein
VQQAFTAQRSFLLVATKAKKPDIATCMEILKDLQAAMEKVDDVRQRNREANLKDPLSMVADGVGALGWVTVEGSPKPHEYIHDLFGGAQMFGNKVLKEYKDKYVELEGYHAFVSDKFSQTGQDQRRMGARLLQAL